MNENVTNKTPKRRRWIARLLVSALCILLVSSLLFVWVVAENIELVAQFSSSYSIMTSSASSGLFYLSENTFVYGVGSKLYFQQGNTHVASLSLTSTNSWFGSYSFWLDSNILYVSCCSDAYNSSSTNKVYVEFWVIDISNISFPSVLEHFVSPDDFSTFSSSYRHGVAPFCVYNGYIYGICFKSNGASALRAFPFYFSLTNFSDYYIPIIGQSVSMSPTTYESFLGNSFYYSDYCIFSLFGGFIFNTVSNTIVSTYTPVVSSGFVYEGDYYVMSATDLYLLDPVNKTFDIVGSSPVIPYASYASNGALYCFTSLGSNAVVPYTVYTGLPTTEPPPESSDETTESPPPESSDESSEEPPPESSEPDEPGTLNIYRTDIDRSGGVMVFNSTLDTSIPSDGLESLSAYLGYYWDVDSSVQPPPSYMYLWASYEDGTRQRYDFDFSAYGYALGSDFAQNFYYPDYLGMEFEIPLNGETDIYFVTSSPGGSVTVENSDGRIITLNFGSTSSYARIDFVDELNYRITLYNNDMAIGNSLTFDQGVYRYLFVYNVDSAVNTWYYPEPGTSTLINYDKVENGLYNVVLTLNDKIPDYGKPGDFEDAVSRYEEIEGAVSFTMSETWEYLESLQEELNGSFDIVEFSEANAKLDQILSTPGGDTIFAFFKSLWGINPLLPTFAVMTVCFAGVAFIIRKI